MSIRTSIGAVVAGVVVSCSCPSTCESSATQVEMARGAGDFGAPGERLRFRIETNFGLLGTDCTMAGSGRSECTPTGVSATVTDSAGGRIRRIVLRFSPLPETVTVSVVRPSDDSIVAGPATAQIVYPADTDACTCRSGQAVAIKM